jgi:hypothetical protein
MNDTKTETLKIYVADLAAYNEGHLHGKWYDLEEFDSLEELEAAIQEDIIKTSPAFHPEEYMVHDHEYFPDGTGEISVTEAWQIYEFLNQWDDNLEAAKALLSYEHFDLSDEGQRQRFSEMMGGYFGYYPDEKDFAYEIADRGILEVPEHLNGYIDWERVAHCFSIEDYFEINGHYFPRI